MMIKLLLKLPSILLYGFFICFPGLLLRLLRMLMGQQKKISYWNPVEDETNNTQ